MGCHKRERLNHLQTDACQMLHSFSLLCPVFLLGSDYGMRLPILRSNPDDQVLYQTERYNEDTFGYEVPIREEGDYILVMKFSEVYFAQSQQKVGFRNLSLPRPCAFSLSL